MIFKIAICDDDANDIASLYTLLYNYSVKCDIDFHIQIFQNPLEFVSCYTEPGTFDIIFLDVEMSQLSGLTIAQNIRELPDYAVKIIFTSNFPEYMQDSFNVSAFQYLPKPITEQQLHMQFQRIVHELSNFSTQTLLVKHEEFEELVLLNSIISIETVKNEKNQLQFNCTNQTILGYGILRELETQLSPHRFFSPHRGILVNIAKVHFVKPNYLIMKNGMEIPLSRRKHKEFRQLFNNELLTIT